jgi:peptide/nickel transport system ATP-binding protein
MTPAPRADAPPGTPVLEARGLTKVFSQGLIHKQHLVALHDLSFVLPPRRPVVTAIAGESGSGKTTLARLVLGLLTPSTGQVLYNGKDIWRMDRGEWLTYRKQVQAIFQDPYEVYNPFYRVDHVLEMVVKEFKLARSAGQGREMVRDALGVLGLRPDEVLGRYPHQLSGGQRQRIMIARAFLPQPRVIVADEPVSMVDASLRALILENMLRLKREFGISFLYITHDLSTAYQIADDIYVLYRGTVAETGGVTTVIEHPRHPYTQLLVASIPVPDPRRKWQDRVDAGLGETAADNGRSGCPFAGRCPYVMPVCRQAPPPLYPVGDGHRAACYLYRDGEPGPPSASS